MKANFYFLPEVVQVMFPPQDRRSSTNFDVYIQSIYIFLLDVF